MPTSRLIQRLDLVAYDVHPGWIGEFTPQMVRRVRVGDLLGEIPEKAMGARVHASIDGVVESVADGIVTIKAC